jgi:nitroreductase
MSLKEIVLKNRSYRRFDEGVTIPFSKLVDWVDLARNTASGRNAQPLKYFISNTPSLNAEIFQTLAWAGYLPDWEGPASGEQPSAYIVILGDHNISSNFYCDHGIAAQTILLGATEEGFGGCMIAAVKRNKLAPLLKIPQEFEILLVLAMGKPVEKVVLEEIPTDGSYKYWRDEQEVHHVPKRGLKEIIINSLE